MELEQLGAFGNMAKEDLKAVLVCSNGMCICGLRSFPCIVKLLAARFHMVVVAERGLTLALLV